MIADERNARNDSLYCFHALSVGAAVAAVRKVGPCASCSRFVSLDPAVRGAAAGRNGAAAHVYGPAVPNVPA
jgi:hypothetical protein